MPEKFPDFKKFLTGNNLFTTTRPETARRNPFELVNEIGDFESLCGHIDFERERCFPKKQGFYTQKDQIILATNMILADFWVPHEIGS